MQENQEFETDIQLLVETYLESKALGQDCEKLKLALTNKLYVYEDQFYRNSGIDSIAMPFVNALKYCLNSYDSSKQDFLHYFNFSLAREIKKERAKENEQKFRGGIKIDSGTQEMIHLLIKFAKSRNADIYDISFQEQAAKYLNKSIQEIQELIDINDNAKTINTEISNEEGDSISILDMQESGDLSPDEKYEQNATIVEYFEMFEKAFNSLQDRAQTNQIISILLTSKILDTIGMEDIVISEIVKKSFCSKQVLKLYIDKGEVITARQLARVLGIHEASISRTFNNFIKKVKNC